MSVPPLHKAGQRQLMLFLRVFFLHYQPHSPGCGVQRTYLVGKSRFSNDDVPYAPPLQTSKAVVHTAGCQWPEGILPSSLGRLSASVCGRGTPWLDKCLLSLGMELA